MEKENARKQAYCQHGEAENRIKDAQVGLFATRTSCHHHFQSNQLRLYLASNWPSADLFAHAMSQLRSP